MHQDSCFHLVTPTVTEAEQECTEHQTQGSLQEFMSSNRQQQRPSTTSSIMPEDIPRGHEKGWWVTAAAHFLQDGALKRLVSVFFLKMCCWTAGLRWFSFIIQDGCLSHVTSSLVSSTIFFYNLVTCPYCIYINGSIDWINICCKYSEVSRWGPLHITSLTHIFCHALCRWQHNALFKKNTPSCRALLFG